MSGYNSGTPGPISILFAPFKLFRKKKNGPVGIENKTGTTTDSADKSAVTVNKEKQDIHNKEIELQQYQTKVLEYLEKKIHQESMMNKEPKQHFKKVIE